MTLPASIQKVIDLGVRKSAPERVVLFGSRARGDASPTSDYDLVFFGVREMAGWHDFAAEIAFESPSLFGIDVMRYEALPPEIQASVDAEGKSVYEDNQRR
ncbi:MAG: nucleotidyltransferase domain-containing protein [Fimbriimonas sp.]